VLIHPVRIGRCHDRGEVPAEGRPLRRCLPEEGEIGLHVVADRELVVVGAKPAVALPAIQLDPSALVAVVGVLVATSLEVRRERIRRLRDTVRIRVHEPGLRAVAARQPAEQVIEGAILHHQYDHVVDTGVLRVGETRLPRYRGDKRGSSAESGYGNSGLHQEAAARKLFHGRASSNRLVESMVSTSCHWKSTAELRDDACRSRAEKRDRRGNLQAVCPDARESFSESHTWKI
jgi:hypothetical protein